MTLTCLVGGYHLPVPASSSVGFVPLVNVRLRARFSLTPFVGRVSNSGGLPDSVDPPSFPATDTCRSSLGVLLDTAGGKTISYLHEDYRLFQGPDRSSGRIPADGPCRTGAG